MSRQGLARAGRDLLVPAASALIGGLFAAGLLRKGVVMGPDSWAYWKGSVSMLERGSYSYFGGEPVTSFPPLFSAVLAAIQTALGRAAHRSRRSPSHPTTVVSVDATRRAHRLKRAGVS
jgi:hypothetical protein